MPHTIDCTRWSPSQTAMDADVELSAGLVALTGNEGSGKTTWLRRLAERHPDGSSSRAHQAFYLDLNLPDHGHSTPRVVWQQLRLQWPNWSVEWQDALSQAFKLEEHLDKTLNMLSRGSRRKVALVAILVSGTDIACLDQPYAALDWASIKVLREFLLDMADHPSRCWIVADYEADPALPWRQHIVL